MKTTRKGPLARTRLATKLGKGMGSLMHTATLAYLRENNPDAVQLHGLESAIIGVGNQYTKQPLLIYSARKIIEKLMKDGLTRTEALDYYGCNVECLWAGEHTPIIMNDLSVEAANTGEDPHHPTDRITKADTNALTPRTHQGRRRRPRRKNIPRI